MGILLALVKRKVIRLRKIDYQQPTLYQALGISEEQVIKYIQRLQKNKNVGLVMREIGLNPDDKNTIDEIFDEAENIILGEINYSEALVRFWGRRRRLIKAISIKEAIGTILLLLKAIEQLENERITMEILGFFLKFPIIEKKSESCDYCPARFWCPSYKQ